MRRQPKNPYLSSPFISFSRAGQILTIALHVTSPSFPHVRLLSTRNPHTSTFSSISFLLGLGCPRFNVHSPFHAHRSSSSPLDFHCVVHLLSMHRLNFPQPNSHSPVRLLSMHGSSSAQPNFHSPICLHYVHKSGSPPNFRSLIRLLPVHGLGSSRLNSRGPL